MCAEVVCVDIRDIRYFIAIAEEHSMSKAAQSLFVSQPTLSQTIKKLEEWRDGLGKQSEAANQVAQNTQNYLQQS